MPVSTAYRLPERPLASVQDATSPLKIQWITRLAGLEALAREWTELEASVIERTVFSSYDFLSTWYRSYAGLQGDALVGVARRGSKLVGVAPLVARPGCMGKIPVTRIQFAMHDAYSGEFLVEDAHPEIVGAFVDSLVRELKFDVLAFNGIEPATPRFRELEVAARRNGLAIETSNHPNAVVDLKDGYDAYCGAMSRNFRRTVKRQAQRVAAAGAPVVDGVRLTRGVDSIESSIERLFTVNEASYKLEGRRLADCHRTFLADLVRRFGPRGMMHLSLLQIGGRDAAAVMGLVERGCYYDVTLCYDEAFADLSPGAYLMQDVLGDLAGAGVHTMLSHGAHEYKRRWSTAFVPSTRVFLFAKSAHARLSRFVRFQLGAVWRRFGAEDP